MNNILEVVVNGHSGHESTGFNLPNGFAIRFYADDRTTCYVPSTHVATVVNELRAGAGELKNSGNIVNNYMIQFDPNDSTEGVFYMNGTNLKVGESISLKNLIQGLRNQFPTTNIIIYAIFCRGSARENFASHVAPVSEHVGQQALLNEEPLDFDMDFDMGGGKKRKTKRRRTKRRKKRRRRKTKRRVKRRRKTTRKKRGRGLGPSKMAKGAVAALAASAAMGQGMGHGISPSRGTTAAVNHFKEVECKDFHITDIVEHSEDHGQPTEHYRPVLKAALAKKRTCNRRGKPMRNPNTGKPMSKKKQQQAEKRRRAQEREKAEKAAAEKAAAEQQRQQDMEDEVVREMERERAQNSSHNEGSQGMSGREIAAYGAAAAAAGITIAEYMKRQQRRQGQRGRFGQAARAAQNVGNPNRYRATSPGRRRRGYY